jgi:hypothetical protein
MRDREDGETEDNGGASRSVALQVFGVSRGEISEREQTVKKI